MKNAIKPTKPAAAKEIREIVGRDDDELVAAIMKTGASSDEIMQACEWLDDDDYMGAGLQRTMHSKVHNVYDLLLSRRERDERE